MGKSNSIFLTAKANNLTYVILESGKIAPEFPDVEYYIVREVENRFAQPFVCTEKYIQENFVRGF